MNQQDRSFMVTFTMVISVLVLIAIAIFLISKLVSKITVQYDDTASRSIVTADDRIKPVYRVAVAKTSAEATAAPTTPAAAPTAAEPISGEVDLAKGKQVYSTVCMACHMTGAAGAPKLDDKAAWETRAAQGMETLVKHAINGIRGMPAKGGNPALSSNDINNSVHYMLSEAGVKVEAPAPAAAPAPEQPAPAAPAPEPAAAPAPAAAAAIAVPAELDLAHGKQLYNTVCMACHITGAAGAPKLDDKAAWAPRLAQGFDTLVTHAINGIRGMPPKGGAVNLSEQDIKAAVGYMVSEAK